MTLTPAQSKFLHTAVGMVGASGAYMLVNHLTIGADLKVPLLAIIVGAIIRGAGSLLASRTDTPASDS